MHPSINMQGSISNSFFSPDLVSSLLESYNRPNDELARQLASLRLIKSYLPPELEKKELTIKQTIDRILVDGINQLQKSQHSDLLRKRFVDNGGMTKKAFGDEIEKSIQTVSRREKEATRALALLLDHKELEKRQTHHIELNHHLGSATYKTLVGGDELWQGILSSILNPDGKWITVVTGIGGIGKSSQTHKAVSDAIDRSAVDRLMRIDAKNKKLEVNDFLNQVAEWLHIDASDYKSQADLTLQIVKVLKTTPYLILIDGVEEHIADLLNELIGFANPSQIIITSRVEPTDKSKIHYFKVPLLTLAAAKTLLLEAQMAVSQAKSAEISDTNLRRIYEKVGGNPLALKLVGALLGDHSLTEVFDDLIEVNYPDTEKMYRRVYIKTWNGLHKANQDVLAAFGSIKGIRSVSVEMLISLTVPELVESKRELFDVLNFLKTHSLVDIDREDESDKTHYKIHNLTRSFLETDIIDWGR